MNQTDPQARRRVNATKRLHSFLAAIEVTSAQATTPLIELMAGAAGFTEKPGAQRDCLVILSVVDLLQRSEREIKAFLPDEVAFYLRSFEPLYGFFGPRTCTNGWNVVRANFRERYITDIEGAGQRLSGLVSETSLFEADFSDIRDQLRLLYEALQTADISEEVRRSLTRRFEDLERAVDAYQRTGAPGLLEAYESAIGAMAADQRLQGELKEDDRKGGKLLGQIRKVAVATLWLLAAANTVHDADKNFAPVVHQLFLEASPAPGDSTHQSEPNGSSHVLTASSPELKSRVQGT